MRRFVAGIAFVLVSAVFAAPNAMALKLDDRQVLKRAGFDQKLGAHLSLDTVFTDESGQQVPLGKFFGKKPVILTFVYYECPMLCTLVLNGLVSSMRGLSFDVGREYDVVVVSFDPGESSRMAFEKRKNYVARYGRPVGDNWHFLTGEEASIRQLTDQAGFHYEYDAESDEYAHPSGIIVLTPEGKIARYFYGIDFTPRDLKFALMESSKMKIGSFTDQVMIFCFHYDPSTGKYSLAIMNMLRGLGLLTVLLIGGFIIKMIHSEKRPPKHKPLDKIHG